MKAKIEIYNDSGDLVSKYEAPSYEKRIDYEGDYEIRKYYFNFMYAEMVESHEGGVGSDADV